jgi:hypothetical protein
LVCKLHLFSPLYITKSQYTATWPQDGYPKNP